MWGGLLSPRQQTRLPLILPIDQPPRLSALVRCVGLMRWSVRRTYKYNPIGISYL